MRICVWPGRDARKAYITHAYLNRPSPSPVVVCVCVCVRKSKGIMSVRASAVCVGCIFVLLSRTHTHTHKHTPSSSSSFFTVHPCFLCPCPVCVPLTLCALLRMFGAGKLTKIGFYLRAEMCMCITRPCLLHIEPHTHTHTASFLLPRFALPLLLRCSHFIPPYPVSAYVTVK